MKMTPILPDMSFYGGNKEPDWKGSETYQRKIISNQEMTVIQKSDEEPQLFQLFYMEMKSESFLGMQAAKDKSSEFALAVLNAMIENVNEQHK